MPLSSTAASRRPATALRGVLAGCAICLAALLALLPGPARADDAIAQRAAQLLEYVAVDYPVAVEAGVIKNEFEYREQLEFVAQVGADLDRLGVPRPDPLRDRLASLDATVRERGEATRVGSLAQELARALRARFGVKSLPRRPPSVAGGRALYAEACASCHGGTGAGDGPAAAELKPPPSDLTDRERMLALSPLALHGTIRFGIEGTGMAGFADRFDDAELYDLAFYVGSLAFREHEVARGLALFADARRRDGNAPDLATLVERPARELGPDAERLALVAYLRTHPEALRGSDPLGVARRRLAESWTAYRQGESRRAIDLAIAAYLDGFEHVEPALGAADPRLRVEVEEQFLDYRHLLRRETPIAEVEPLLQALHANLDRAEQRLAPGELGDAALFVSSLVILAREGLEAVLLVAAIAGVLIRSQRRDALRYVHAGWIGALVAGGLTWFAARELVRVSGAQREVIEGLSSLLATAILFYVSYWLVSKLETARWQSFLNRQLRSALSRGSLWALASVSFVAVYREIFETLLFYQALFAQAGAQGARAVGLGIVAGTGLLVVIALGMFRFGRRIPLRPFFAASSALLYLLAVVMAGQGIAALQEAGWVSRTPIRGIRVDWLGIYPTAEGMALQAALVVAAGLGLVAALWIQRPRADRSPAQARP